MLSHAEFLTRRQRLLRASKQRSLVKRHSRNVKRSYLCAICGKPLTSYANGLYDFTATTAFYIVPVLKGFNVGVCKDATTCWRSYLQRHKGG